MELSSDRFGKPDIKAVSDRILALAMREDLDPIDRAALEVLQSRTVWSLRQLAALSTLEEVYEVDSV